MLASTNELSIDIPGGGPFGFKLQGGKEYMTPLVILSMSEGGKALVGGLKEGDVLIGINKSPTYGLRHPEALKLVKAAKDGLNLSVVRGLSSRDESLEAMKRYSEEPIECLPPPPCDDGFPPPPPDLFDLPPPPPTEVPPPPTEVPTSPPPPPPPVKAPPPPVKAPPPIKTPDAIKAAKAASQVKTPPPVKVVTPPAAKPGPPMATNGESPKSNLCQFGEQITERAKQRDMNTGQNGTTTTTTKLKTGRYFKILQDQIQEYKAAEADGMDPLELDMSVTVTSPVAKVPAISPKTDQPKAEPVKTMPATNISLLNMTYTPGKGSKSPIPRPSKVTPKDPLTPPAVPSAPSPVVSSPVPAKPTRAKSQDIIKTPVQPTRTKSQDIIKTPVNDEVEVQMTPSELKKRFEKTTDQVNKPTAFTNKGSFYTRFASTPDPSTSEEKTVVSPNITKLQSPTNTSPTTPTTPKSTSPPFSSSPKPLPVTTSYAGPKPATSSPKPTTPPVKNFKSTPVRPKPKEITPPPSPDPIPKTTSKPNFTPQFSFNSTFSSSPTSLDSPPSFHKSRNSSSSSSGSDKKNPVRPNMVSLLDGLTVNNTSSPPKLISEPTPKQPSSGSTSSPKSTSSLSTSSNSSPEKKSLLAPKTPLLPICKTCNSEIRGPYVGAQGRAWHSEHFVCGQCKGDLNDGFKEVEDQLYCGSCYFKTHGDKCAKCGEIIKGSAVEALGNTYHPDHFTCTKCDARFSGGFNVNEGDPYCQSCYNKIFMPSCAGCGKTIEGITEWISALDENWHNGCFVCYTCKAPLGGKTFYQKNGQAVCQKHAKGP